METKNCLLNQEGNKKTELIKKLQNYGYEPSQNGQDYSKSFVSLGIIHNGMGEFPLLMCLDLNHQDAIDITGNKKKTEHIINTLLFTLSDKDDIHINKNPQDPDFTKESMSGTHLKGSDTIIADLNWAGVEYLEKVLEQLEVPGFDAEYREAIKLPKARFLKNLGFFINRNKEKNNRLTGDLSFCHVEHAKITQPTPEQLSYVPYEWKIRLDIENNSLFTKILKKDVRKMSLQIIKKYGSPKYRDGKKNYLQKDPIVFRVNDTGVEKIAEMTKIAQNLISMPTGQ